VKDVMLPFLCDDALEMDRFLARVSCDFLVCDIARWGMTGASSFEETLDRPGPGK